MVKMASPNWSARIAVPTLTISVAFVVGMLLSGLIASPSVALGSATPGTGLNGAIADHPPDCRQAPLDLRPAKRLTHQVAGALNVSDARVLSWYRTQDSRNFSVELTAAELATSGLTQGRIFNEGKPVVIVFSFGDFDPKDVVAFPRDRSAPTGGPAAVHSDLVMEIVDAASGAWAGEAVLKPGCHTE